MRFSIVNFMVDDALAPCVTRSPAAMRSICRIARSLAYMRNGFSYMCHVNVEQSNKM